MDIPVLVGKMLVSPPNIGIKHAALFLSPQLGTLLSSLAI